MPSNLKKRAMIAIIDGNEEIESIMISNILRRADNEVVIAKVENNDFHENDFKVKLARGQIIVI